MREAGQQTDEPLSDARWFLRGVLAALSFPAWTVALALVGVGSLARDAGHPVGAATLSTLLIWAGPAQVIFYGGLAAGMAPLAVAAAVCFSSIRFLPMTMAILPMVRRPGDGIVRQAYAAHFVAVTVWSESLRRLPELPQQGRTPFYFGFAHACLLLSAASTAAGYYMMGAFPTPLAAGLLFLTPIFFTLSVAGGARRAADWFAVSLGFLLEPVVAKVTGDSFDLLAVGLIGGTAAFVLGRWWDRRRVA
ncbi:AzlC family ABC transporter permease [Alsobacter sp. R-9]